MPIIALTFDDGPNTVITPQVLDLLEEHGIVASFFLIAQNITPESAEVVRRAKKMGCDIENHTVTHTAMNEMTPEEIRAEDHRNHRRGAEILPAALHRRQPGAVRYGRHDRHLRRRL